MNSESEKKKRGEEIHWVDKEHRLTISNSTEAWGLFTFIFLSHLLFCFVCSLLFSGIGLIHNYTEISLKNSLAFKKLKRINSVIKFRKLERLIFAKRLKNNNKSNKQITKFKFLIPASSLFLHPDLLSFRHSPFVTSIKATMNEYLSVTLPQCEGQNYKIRPLIWTSKENRVQAGTCPIAVSWVLTHL